MTSEQRAILLEFAEALANASPETRVEMIEALNEETSFCWDCGYVMGPSRMCHCQNDE